MSKIRYPDDADVAASIAWQKSQFELAGVRDGTCDCASKKARSVRVAGWLICDRSECSRVING